MTKLVEKQQNNNNCQTTQTVVRIQFRTNLIVFVLAAVVFVGFARVFMRNYAMAFIQSSFKWLCMLYN